MIFLTFWWLRLLHSSKEIFCWSTIDSFSCISFNMPVYVFLNQLFSRGQLFPLLNLMESCKHAYQIVHQRHFQLFVLWVPLFRLKHAHLNINSISRFILLCYWWNGLSVLTPVVYVILDSKIHLQVRSFGGEKRQISLFDNLVRHEMLSIILLYLAFIVVLRKFLWLRTMQVETELGLGT